jgi:hypothetical protein
MTTPLSSGTLEGGAIPDNQLRTAVHSSRWLQVDREPTYEANANQSGADAQSAAGFSPATSDLSISTNTPGVPDHVQSPKLNLVLALTSWLPRLPLVWNRHALPMQPTSNERAVDGFGPAVHPCTDDPYAPEAAMSYKA